MKTPQVSLAVRHEAIHEVQVTPVPLIVDADDAWVGAATSRLMKAAQRPAPEPKTNFERIQRRRPSALSIEATRLEEEVADRLPYGLRDRFHAFFDERSLTADPSAFPSKLVGLTALVNDPLEVLALLDTVPWREV